MAFALPSGITSGIQSAQSAFDGAIGNAGGTCDLFGSLGGFLDGVDFGGVTRAIDDVLGEMEDVIKDAMEAAGKIMSEINNAIDSVIGPILEQANALFDTMTQAAKDAVNAALGALDTAIGGITSAIGSVFEGLTSAFGQLEDALASGLKSLGAAACGIASQGLAAMPAGASALADQAKGALAGGPAAVGSAVMGAQMNGVADAMKNAASSMASTSIGQVAPLNQAVSSMTSALQSAIASV